MRSSMRLLALAGLLPLLAWQGAADGYADSNMATATSSASTDFPAAFKQCAVCHSVRPGQNQIGPSLAGIFGAKGARVKGFRYSQALRTSGLIWDEKALDAFLESPVRAVPGTSMPTAGIPDHAVRAEIIAYLKAL